MDVWILFLERDRLLRLQKLAIAQHLCKGIAKLGFQELLPDPPTSIIFILSYRYFSSEEFSCVGSFLPNLQ
jgi:hypothetical protein